MTKSELLAEIRRRVARGASLLDERAPGWADRVNMDRLAMKSCDRCVLGQVYGEYMDGLAALGLEDGVEQGFSYACSEYNIFDRSTRSKLWKWLAAAWRYEVRKRVAVLEEVTV